MSAIFSRKATSLSPISTMDGNSQNPSSRVHSGTPPSSKSLSNILFDNDVGHPYNIGFMRSLDKETGSLASDSLLRTGLGTPTMPSPELLSEMGACGNRGGSRPGSTVTDSSPRYFLMEAAGTGENGGRSLLLLQTGQCTLTPGSAVMSENVSSFFFTNAYHIVARGVFVYKQ